MREESCALGLEGGQSIGAHESGPDPDVEVYSILDSLAFGHPLKEQTRADTGGVDAGEPGALHVRRQGAVELVPVSEPGWGRRHDVTQCLTPEASDPLGCRAIEGDLELTYCCHHQTISEQLDERTSMSDPGSDAAVGDAEPTVREVSVVLFDGFELLDVFGPVEILSVLPEQFRITMVAAEVGLVASSQGTRVEASGSFANSATPDIVMVPGGIGSRALVDDEGYLEQLRGYVDGANLVTSVCTGSAILAAAGLLDGYRATSNKRSFDWAAQQGGSVTWERRARWVQDRDRWTSSGVAAGIDMTAALIAELFDIATAEHAAAVIEYQPQTDPDNDPFAER